MGMGGATSAFNRHQAEQSRAAGEGQQKGLEFIRFAEKLLKADPEMLVLKLYRKAEDARTESRKIDQAIDQDVADKLPKKREELQEDVLKVLREKGLPDIDQRAVESFIDSLGVGKQLSQEHPQAEKARMAGFQAIEAQEALNEKLRQIIEDNNTEVFRRQVASYELSKSGDGEAVNVQVLSLDKRAARGLLMAALGKMAADSPESKT